MGGRGGLPCRLNLQNPVSINTTEANLRQGPPMLVKAQDQQLGNEKNTNTSKIPSKAIAAYAS